MAKTFPPHPPAAQQPSPGGVNRHHILNNIIDLESEASFTHCLVVGSTSLCFGGWFRSDVTTKRQLVHCVCSVVALLHLMSWHAAAPRDKYDIDIAWRYCLFGALMGGGHDDDWLHLGLVVEPQVWGGCLCTLLIK